MLLRIINLREKNNSGILNSNSEFRKGLIPQDAFFVIKL